MESCSATSNVGAAYEAQMAVRAKDQQKVEGDAAVRLVEASQVAPGASANRPMPLDATISIRA